MEGILNLEFGNDWVGYYIYPIAKKDMNDNINNILIKIKIFI